MGTTNLPQTLVTIPDFRGTIRGYQGEFRPWIDTLFLQPPESLGQEGKVMVSNPSPVGPEEDFHGLGGLFIPNP